MGVEVEEREEGEVGEGAAAAAAAEWLLRAPRMSRRAAASTPPLGRAAAEGEVGRALGRRARRGTSSTPAILRMEEASFGGATELLGGRGPGGRAAPAAVDRTSKGHGEANSGGGFRPPPGSPLFSPLVVLAPPLALSAAAAACSPAACRAARGVRGGGRGRVACGLGTRGALWGGDSREDKVGGHWRQLGGKGCVRGGGEG